MNKTNRTALLWILGSLGVVLAAATFVRFIYHYEACSKEGGVLAQSTFGYVCVSQKQ